MDRNPNDLNQVACRINSSEIEFELLTVENWTNGYMGVNGAKYNQREICHSSDSVELAIYRSCECVRTH
jgi:hypothetical protein